MPSFVATMWAEREPAGASTAAHAPSAAWAVERRTRNLGAALAGFLLLILLSFSLVGTRPFSGTETDSISTASDGVLNQLVWLGAVALALPLALSRWRLALALTLRAWPLLLVLAWITVTALWSPYPGVTVRRAAVLWLMYAAALGVAVTDIPIREFHRLAFLLVGIVLALDVLGAIAIPSRAINAEGQLVGMHGHKNSTGQVAVMATLCWYFYAKRYPWNGFRLGLLASTAFFYLLILATGSKTGSALAMLVILWTSLAAEFARKGPSGGAMGWSAIGFLTLATVIVLMLSDVSAGQIGTLIFGDLSFTGRWQLWEAIWQEVVKHFWLGYGFGAFWDVNGADNAFGLSKSVGWLGVVGQAHNGYLDLFLQTGLIGLVLALFSLAWILRLGHRILRPMPGHPFDGPACEFAYAMILSIALYNLMESSYLRPHHLHAIWLFLLVPILQRRLLAAERGVPATHKGGSLDLATGIREPMRPLTAPLTGPRQPRSAETSSPE